MHIRSGELGDIAACHEIAASLPRYFTAPAITAIQDDLRHHQLYVAVESGQVIGFMTVVHKSDRVSEVSWMAVRPDRQGRGCGSALMAHVCAELKASGTRLLEVKTLAATVASPRYARTKLKPRWNPQNRSDRGVG